MNHTSPLLAPQTLKIRAAGPKDYNILKVLNSVCFSGDRLSPRQIGYWLSHPTGKLLLAEVHREIVAQALLCYRKTSPWARLHTLAVVPSARGIGIAAALLLAAERDAFTLGKQFLRLQVASSNIAAIRLYQKFGYVVIDRYSNYYEDQTDCLRMEKSLQVQGTS